jgi:hypothetical protein
MQKDAHYYAILAFCRVCGFKKESAHKVAYASQFVDDAKINLIFFHEPQEFVSEHDVIEGKPAFFNMATCHSYAHIKTYNYEAMTNNTVAFHFVPGCRGENFSKKMRCQEESPVILTLLEEALKEGDLIKLGMTLHAYADTFSHQGFSGILSKVNDIKHCRPHAKVYSCLKDKYVYFMKGILDSLEDKARKWDLYEKLLDLLIPAYGHGQAMFFPDYAYLKWSYAYDYSDEFSGTYQRTEIDNRERYRRAFLKIYEYLTEFVSRHQQYLDPDLKLKNHQLVQTKLLPTLLAPGTLRNREKRWQKVMLEEGLFNNTDQHIITYDEDYWLKNAFANYNRPGFNRRKVKGVQLATNFANSDWYKFYLAVKWYKKKFFQACRDNQLDIPN